MKKLWKFLNGKKTVIAGAYWGFTIPAMFVLFPDGAPEIVGRVVDTVGLALTYAGLGHKVVKSPAIANLRKDKIEK